MLTTRQFAARYPDFEQRGVELVRIFRSPVNALRDHAEGAHAVPFPVLGDPERVVYRSYGVSGSLFSLRALFTLAARERMHQAAASGIKPRWRDALRDGIAGSPADFLIDAAGRIVQLQYGRHFADSITPVQALAWIDTAATGAAAPRPSR